MAAKASAAVTGPAPTTAAIAKATTRVGTANASSANRRVACRIAVPPKAMMAPMAMPNPSVATKATATASSDGAAPANNRAARSRPK